MNIWTRNEGDYGPAEKLADQLSLMEDINGYIMLL